MHRVTFVVYPGFELLDTSGPSSVFNGANRALSGRKKPPFYAIDLVSAAGGPVASSSGITVHTQSLEKRTRDMVDTLLIVGAEREHLLPILADKALSTWIPQLAAKAQRLGSVCSGAFILARLGLIDGHRIATHWDACAPLAATFPSVTVDPNSLYVIDGRLWTSAGVTTGIDMALAMVAHDLSADIAGEIAKRLVLYARRPGYQSQFSPLLDAQISADTPFTELIAWILANLNSPLNVPQLADRAGLSERTFHRRFAAATGETPARFVETARLDAARMLLCRGLSLKTVAAKVGLSPASRFCEAFERRFGLAPRLFREMHAEF